MSDVEHHTHDSAGNRYGELVVGVDPAKVGGDYTAIYRTTTQVKVPEISTYKLPRRTLWGRILCHFGLHDWIMVDDPDDPIMAEKEVGCHRCDWRPE